MSKLQTPKHKGTRSFLRVAGALIAAVGLIFLIIGMASFFTPAVGNESPRLFWCFLVGVPVLAAELAREEGDGGGGLRRLRREQVLAERDDGVDDSAVVRTVR